MHGALKLPLTSLAEEIKKHYHTSRPFNDVRNLFAAKVRELEKLCDITEATAIRALQNSNKSQTVSALDAAEAAARGGAFGSQPIPTSNKRTMLLKYGPLRLVTLDGSSMQELGLGFARERKGAVVQSIEPEKPAAQSELVFEHDVVLKVPLAYLFSHATHLDTGWSRQRAKRRSEGT